MVMTIIIIIVIIIINNNNNRYKGGVRTWPYNHTLWWESPRRKTRYLGKWRYFYLTDHHLQGHLETLLSSVLQLFLGVRKRGWLGGYMLKIVSSCNSLHILFLDSSCHFRQGLEFGGGRSQEKEPV